MDDLDALLGPKKSKEKTLIVTIGASNPLSDLAPPPKQQKLAVPKGKEEEDEQLAVKLAKPTHAPVKVPGKQLLISNVGVCVALESDSTKAERLERRKRAREELEAQKKALVSAVERDRQDKLDREYAEAADFVEQIHAKNTEARAKLQEELSKQTVANDGSEKPATFDVDEREMIAADEARAARLDAQIPVPEYYSQDAFPVGALVQFATQNGRVELEQCELAFVINGVWWRNKRFYDEDALHKFILNTKPDRIELGPQYPPGDMKKEHHSQMNLRRYLVFDVDFGDDNGNDYIRACSCKGKRTTCSTGCWFYMRVAVKVLTYLLRRCFGCQFIVPVFSGRRGVHVWCLDETFLSYTSDERKGLVERIELYGTPGMYSHPEHTPYLYEFIMQEEFYAQFIGGRVLILETASMQAMLRCCGSGLTVAGLPPYVAERVALLHGANGYEARLAAWKDWCSTIDEWKGWPPSTYEREFVFSVLFPRLDRAVTVAMNHCIKSVFVIHPDTKRCSVPIPDIDTWRPDMAPRISELVDVPMTAKQRQQQNRPEWQLRKEAETRDAVLTQYVAHMCKMVAKAYPFQVMMPNVPVGWKL